jgi:hypothetical protein
MVSQSLTALMFRRLGFRPWLLGLKAATGLITEALAGPFVASRWAYARQSQEACLERAEAALTKAGYQRLERTEQSRYGTADDYTVAIRCVTDNEIAFLVASSPARDKTDRLAGELLQHFGTGQK